MEGRRDPTKVPVRTVPIQRVPVERFRFEHGDLSVPARTLRPDMAVVAALADPGRAVLVPPRRPLLADATLPLLALTHLGDSLSRTPSPVWLLGGLRISCQRASVKILVDCVNRTPEQRTLNPRVRGSSPWRRTCKVFTFDLRLCSRLALTFRSWRAGSGLEAGSGFGWLAVGLSGAAGRGSVACVACCGQGGVRAAGRGNGCRLGLWRRGGGREAGEGLAAAAPGFRG